MKQIIVFGTFDILHSCHENFFEQAKNLGEYLIVVVARDKFVKEAKGKYPANKEPERVKNVRKSNLPNKVVLGSKVHNFYQTIRTYRVDILALGYDQRPKINDLKRKLKRHRLAKVELVRLKAYKHNSNKTKLLIKY